MSGAFVTSVRVDPKGGHEYVSIWIRSAFVGTLCVGEGQGQRLCQLLQGEAELSAGEHRVTWRGSVLDLVTDLRAVLRVVDLAELAQELGRLLNPDPPGAERIGGRLPEDLPLSAGLKFKLEAKQAARQRLPECPNPACMNARLLARGAPGYRRSFHRMDGNLLEARELFKAVLRGAVPVSVADGIQAWLASPLPKRWPPTALPTEDEVLAAEAVIIDDPPPRHGVELTPEGQARLEAWAAEHCGSDERAEAD